MIKQLLELNVTLFVVIIDVDLLIQFDTNCETIIYLQTIDRYGRIDILVTNYAINVEHGDIVDLNAADWDKVGHCN